MCTLLKRIFGLRKKIENNSAKPVYVVPTAPEAHNVVQEEITLPPILPDPEPWSSIELISSPQHGKTSFLWALSFMARKLSLVWPEYVLWPQDTATDESFRSMLRAMDNRELPTEATASSQVRLSLRGMERWGDRRLFVDEGRDPVFGVVSDAGTVQREFNWGVPVCWLLSLPDLGTEDSQFVDLQLDNLIRARMRSARSYEGEPLRLVVALTKADRIPNLPRELREYLKIDPLAAVVKAEAALSDVGVEPERPVLHFDSKAVQLYLETLWGVHETIADWLRTTLTGSLLARRADAHQIALRFCLVSATGSDLRSNGNLAIPWRPRRVLDPLFWTLEMGGR